jgi:hypothetical protein
MVAMVIFWLVTTVFDTYSDPDHLLLLRGVWVAEAARRLQ